MRKSTRYRWAAAATAALLTAGGVAAAVIPRAHAAPKAPVAVILLENTDYSSVVGDTTDAPYINNTLIPSGTLYTNYYAVSHPSLPNYLALVTGDTCGKDGTDNVPPLCSETTLFNQFNSAGIKAGEYAENESANCSYASDSTSNYAERHDPYASDSAAEGISPCGDHTLGTGTGSPGVGSLVTALKSSSPPQFAFVTPNLCDDAHDCPLSSADSWLSANVPSLLNAGADVIVTFDESLSDSTNGGGQVMTAQVGPGVTAGARDSTLYTHYSTLAGIEQYFGLPHLSNAASATPLPVGGSSSSPSPTPSTSGPSPSVLDNETFEDGGLGSWQDWFGEKISNTTAQAHSGTHSLQIASSGQDWGIQQNWPGVPVTGSAQVTFTGWLRNASTSDNGIAVTVDWLDANGNELGTQTISAADNGSRWTEFSGTFTPQANTVSAWLSISNGNGGTHFLDDFMVTQGGSPSPSPSTTSPSPSPSPSTTSPSPSPSPSTTSPSPTPSSPSPPAVLDDETFENGSISPWADWYGESVSNTTAQAHSGTHSLQIASSGQDWGIQQDWPGSASVTPGAATTFSGWLKNASGSDNGIVVLVVCLDPNGNPVGSTQTIDASDNSAGWTEFSGTFTPPAGTVTAWETIQGGNGGTHYLDDFKVTDSGLFS